MEDNSSGCPLRVWPGAGAGLEGLFSGPVLRLPAARNCKLSGALAAWLEAEALCLSGAGTGVRHRSASPETWTLMSPFKHRDLFEKPFLAAAEILSLHLELLCHSEWLRDELGTRTVWGPH